MGLIMGSQVRKMTVANCEPAENSHFLLGFAGSQENGCEPPQKTADFCGVRRFAGSHPYRGTLWVRTPRAAPQVSNTKMNYQIGERA